MGLSFGSNFERRQYMNKSKLKAVLAVNAGAIAGICLTVWFVTSEANRMAAIGIGILGVLILNAALLFRFRASRNTSEPNHRSHFGSILMLVLILFAILIHFISK